MWMEKNGHTRVVVLDSSRSCLVGGPVSKQHVWLKIPLTTNSHWEHMVCLLYTTSAPTDKDKSECKHTRCGVKFIAGGTVPSIASVCVCVYAKARDQSNNIQRDSKRRKAHNKDKTTGGHNRSRIYIYKHKSIKKGTVSRVSCCITNSHS